MDDQVRVKVKITSHTTVKPSLPLASHPKTYTLSLLDQLHPATHTPALLYYAATAQDAVNISCLKMSLSQTLDEFYPLAGHFLDESTISCNHQGIPFTETLVNCHLSVALTSPHKLKLLNKFLPPQEPECQSFSKWVPLAIQINVFRCGGVVIGIYMQHKLLDATSLGTFLKYWSTLASKRFHHLVRPNFEARLKAFPSLPKAKQLVVPHPSTPIESKPIATNTIVKSFIFYENALTKLKIKATTEEIPNPTRFEVVAGFIWEHTLAAMRNAGAQFDQTELTMTVNMRPKIAPPLPREAMGNLVTIARAKAKNSSGQQFEQLVKEIHSGLSKHTQKITTIYQGVNGPEVICATRKAEILQNLEDRTKAGVLRFSSWCKLGFDKVDFGFGNPVWIVPTNYGEFFANFVYLTDFSRPNSGVGIEAWLYLKENVMQILESNQQFLAFASPN